MACKVRGVQWQRLAQASSVAWPSGNRPAMIWCSSDRNGSGGGNWLKRSRAWISSSAAQRRTV